MNDIEKEKIQFKRIGSYDLPLVELFPEKDPMVSFSKEIYEKISLLGDKSEKILDVGCNVGTIINALSKENKKIFGADISLKNCKLVKKANVNVILADALNLPFKVGTFDFIICTMLIEHLNEDILLRQINMTMKNQGNLFLETVFKNKSARYIYKNKNGEYVLTPEHIKEYTSIPEIKYLLHVNGFKIKSIDLIELKYPLIDLIIKVLLRVFRHTYYQTLKNVISMNIVHKLRMKIKIRIPGYYKIEIFATKFMDRKS